MEDTVLGNRIPDPKQDILYGSSGPAFIHLPLAEAGGSDSIRSIGMFFSLPAGTYTYRMIGDTVGVSMAAAPYAFTNHWVFHFSQAITSSTMVLPRILDWPLPIRS